jgi:hypothetical protein
MDGAVAAAAFLRDPIGRASFLLRDDLGGCFYRPIAMVTGGTDTRTRAAFVCLALSEICGDLSLLTQGLRACGAYPYTQVG